MAADDSIIDPCLGNRQLTWSSGEAALPDKAIKSRLLLKNTTPSEDSSWLEYHSLLIIHRDRTVVRQVILQSPEPEDTNYYQNSIGQLNYQLTTGGTNDIAQRSGKSRYTANLIGSARRAGYPIPRPALTTIGTATETEEDGEFITTIEDNALGVPVYAARWNIHYNLDGPPGTVLPIANVAKGVTDVGVAEQPYGP